MLNKTEFYVHAEKDCHIFALKLGRIALVTALSNYGEKYHLQFLQRQVDWLTCLINVGSKQTIYDLRIISQPNAENFTEGVLQIGLLCKICDTDAESALAYADELLRLSQTFFEDEYEFSPVESPEELEFFRLPFQIEDSFQVMRRSEIAELDLLLSVPKRQMGFKAESKSFSKAENRIFHVYPFTLSNIAPATNLLKLLLWQKKPLAVSFRLFPTCLTENEISFLIKEISRCENYTRILPAHNEESGVFSLQTQAHTFHSHLTRSLGILKDNAGFLRIEVAGQGKVPQTLVEVLGSYLTQPTGGRGDFQDKNAFLSGGYDYSQITGKQLSRCRKAWKHLEILFDTDKSIPPEAARLRHLFDSTEAVTAFRFPSPTVEEIVGLKCKSYRTQLFAGNVKEGQLIGYSKHNNHSKEVRLSRSDRRRHIYAVGQTGTGKTTMFESMILDDMKRGEGICVLDPHGDLIEKLLRKIPAERAEDVILFDPGDMQRPIGFNILEYETEAQKHFLIQELLAIIERILQKLDPAMGGPIFSQHSKMVLQLVMSNPKKAGTLAQFYQVFCSSDFYKKFLPLPKPDAILQKFVDETLAKTNYTHISPDGASFGGYIGSKYEPFIGDPMLRNIFGQPRSTINLKKIMDEGKILLVNLSKGRMGEINARFFGMVLIAKLQAAAMSRASMPESKRRDFYLYVDEFQNLATQNFSVLLAEARKYRLNLILTNQFVTQVPMEIMNAITGNVGTIISFRVGSIDAEFLERDFLPVFNRYDLMNLPNFNTYTSTLVDGQVLKPFSMRIVSDFSPECEETAEKIKLNSRTNFGMKREIAEKVIEESLNYEPEKLITHETEWMRREKILDQAVENLELSVRTLNNLKKAQIITVRQLISRSEKDLREIEKIGSKSVNEINAILKSMRLKLQTDDTESDFLYPDIEDLNDLIFDDDDF